MKFQVLTLFPEFVECFGETALLGRAVKDGKIAIEATQLRNFAINRHGQIDDTPYGGGSGMVLRPEPAKAAIEHARTIDPQTTVILLTPRGKPFTQEVALALQATATEKGGGLTFLCPRYEGVDERVTSWVDQEISIGDYVLMGGEVGAMVIIEAVARLLPTVLGNAASTSEESFSKQGEVPLLEHPQYTKPEVFEGVSVPELLLSGDHNKVLTARREAQIDATIAKRPDLLSHKKSPLVRKKGDLSVALIHYPVVDKNGEIVTSSITNLDIHDIARSCRTYGIDRFYIVHPTKALRRLAERILDHWDHGFGSTYNPNRSEALATISIVPEFEDIITDIEHRTGMLPRLVTTSAKLAPESLGYEQFRATLMTKEVPHLLLFGTGWGLADELMQRADFRLAPIFGPTEYNHLSVRSAVAIILDRLLAAG